MPYQLAIVFHRAKQKAIKLTQATGDDHGSQNHGLSGLCAYFEGLSEFIIEFGLSESKKK